MYAFQSPSFLQQSNHAATKDSSSWIPNSLKRSSVGHCHSHKEGWNIFQLSRTKAEWWDQAFIRILIHTWQFFKFKLTFVQQNAYVGDPTTKLAWAQQVKTQTFLGYFLSPPDCPSCDLSSIHNPGGSVTTSLLQQLLQHRSQPGSSSLSVLLRNLFVGTYNSLLPLGENWLRSSSLSKEITLTLNLRDQ